MMWKQTDLVENSTCASEFCASFQGRVAVQDLDIARPIQPVHNKTTWETSSTRFRAQRLKLSPRKNQNGPNAAISSLM